LHVVTAQLKQYPKIYKQIVLVRIMDFLKFLKFSMIFFIGCLAGMFFNLYVYSELENPILNKFGIGSLDNKTVPYDLLDENQIEIYSDRVIIRIENASIGRYAATGSMIPVLNEGSNGIRIVPKSENDIHVGQIITFEENNLLIVHRVIEKGIDDNGVYFITKGDNNDLDDGKVRFEDIKYITIGVIW